MTSIDGTLALDSQPDYERFQESDMSGDGRKRLVVGVSLSEGQVSALDTAAKEAGKNRSEFVRDLLKKEIENFPDDLAGHGENFRTGSTKRKD